MSKIVLITGASRGFGKIWAEALLQRGDKVAATARDLKSLTDLVEKYGEAVLPIQLDVNNREDCFAAVQQVAQHFGKIDVLINNAGYGLFGTIEETSAQEARDQFETNFFGLLWMTQAVLPIMRNQKSGHIIQVSSYLGLVALPVLGLYTASKFAVEGLSETLATEVKAFGINVSLIEPNGYATDWAGASSFHTESMEIYNPLKKAFFEGASPEAFGEPQATAAAVLTLIDAANPPLRLLLGKIAYPAVKDGYEARLQSWTEWKTVSDAAHGK
ncbi:SDR family NAD(P)-dependent oxidoreductase [Sphingobacterium sp. MYb382]|uniref:SDR family NAD(P)-dependent oxidoreductase n=1 Tax=Sphingobacterium sp. MYb382 TaxID=2745278 RepID=UPI0030ACF174